MNLQQLSQSMEIITIILEDSQFMMVIQMLLPPIISIKLSYEIIKSKRFIVSNAQRSKKKSKDEFTLNYVTTTRKVLKQTNILSQEEPLLMEIEFFERRINNLNETNDSHPKPYTRSLPMPMRAQTQDGDDHGVVSVFLRQWGLLK